MKKVILIFLAAIAFSCGDNNRSSQSGTESETEDNYSREPMESDTTDMQMDTTSTQDQNLPQSDTTDNSNNR